MLIAADTSKSQGYGRDGSPLANLPMVPLAMSRRSAEALWRTAGWPFVDKLTDDVDWVYCPKELYVPVKEARTALTVHDLFWMEPSCHDNRISHHLQRMVLRKALKKATVVLTVSEFTKSRIVDLVGLSPSKIRIVGNGVEQGYFEVIHEDPVACTPFPGQDYLVSVGGLTKKKGAESLLRLAQAIAKELPQMILVIVGPVEAAYEKRAGVAANIKLIRRGIADHDLQRLVRGAAVAIVLSEYEGFGIPVLEAMAAGVPVIASDRGALPEVVADAGVVVDPQRTTDIVDRVVAIARNGPLRDSLIEKGRAHASGYTWDRCVGRLAAALEEFGPARHV